MATFAFAFLLLLAVVVAMSLGVMLMGKTIKGSCGGLNAIAGTDKCVVCSQPIDPDSPIRDKLDCKRTCKKAEAMRAQIEAGIDDSKA
ncbi:(Na+)-NQR maturation NqrM [Fluviibacterium sp. DFM31]|uniref:(Na+)-NQR maturation NqrM n=1 Tax=Meridianimarinicoccus marinus TaxID=3231483 RepID=A0ABV3L465_9RHOB